MLNRLKLGKAGARGDNGDSDSDIDKSGSPEDNTPITYFRFRIIAMICIVSLGGLIFGYDTGQISGFVQMEDFLQRFGERGPDGSYSFSNSREGTIVGLLSIGTLVGAVVNGPVADFLGRRLAIVFWNIVFCVGVIVQIASTTKWYQVAIGRLVAGFGVGALSVLTPMYQSETAPKQIRGAMVSCYQLFITLGIFIAYAINYGTHTQYIYKAASWQIPMGVGFIFSILMCIGIMCLSESPRWDYRKGRTERAEKTLALSYGVPASHREVRRELREIKEKFDAEAHGGGHPWYEIFTGPRMAYRTLLGIVMQSLQQLTGANFFFYYGTTIFQKVGLSDSFATQMILGAVNFGSTFFGLYVVEHFGRRKSLIFGALWMFVCFLIFASVGHFQLNANVNVLQAGQVMIAFTCIFIFGYAITWGPIVWALIGEIYPSRYRSTSMGFATSANWTWNFLIAFFTPYITSAIDFRYGYVFAGCNFAAAFVVFFFVCESQGRSLEEIDTMYVMHVPPWRSSSWKPPRGEAVGQTDAAYLSHGGMDINKEDSRGEGGITGEERKENYVG